MGSPERRDRRPRQGNPDRKYEPGVSVLTISGSYENETIDTPFAGYLYKQDKTGKVFGDIIDPLGSAQVLGRMREQSLFVIKLYDPKSYDLMFPRIPIFYRLTKGDENWTGRYHIQQSVSGRVQCSIDTLDTGAPLLTFVHDNWYDRSTYDQVSFEMRQRLTEREQEILRLHPEHRSAMERVRGYIGDAPRLKF